MALVPTSVKRETSTTGEDFLVFNTTDNKLVQGAALVDGSGSHLGISTRRLYVQQSEATIPTDGNLRLSASNTEFSYTIPDNTRALVVRPRDDSTTVRYAWTTGYVATSASPYQTIKPGTEHVRSNVDLNNRTLYFATSSTASPWVEIETWASTAYTEDLALGIFNVKNYGAAGDGVTDDKAAIEATFTAAMAASGRVYFPEGTYLVSDCVYIFLTGDVEVYGNGATLVRDYSGLPGGVDGSILRLSGETAIDVSLTSMATDMTADSKVITVTSTTGMEAGDGIFIFSAQLYMGASASYYRAFMSTISRVINATQIELSDPVPYAITASGNQLGCRTFASPYKVKVSNLSFQWNGGCPKILGTSIASITGTTTITVTTSAPHGLAAGNTVAIMGTAAFDETDNPVTVLASGLTTTQFQYTPSATRSGTETVGYVYQGDPNDYVSAMGLYLDYLWFPIVEGVRIRNTFNSGFRGYQIYGGVFSSLDIVTSKLGNGYGYGIVAGSWFNCVLRDSTLVASRHAIAFSGYPSVNSTVSNCHLRSEGFHSGYAFDAHVMHRLLIDGCTLEGGAKWSGMYITFNNCDVTNHGTIVCFANRIATSQQGDVNVINCRLRLVQIPATGTKNVFVTSNGLTTFGNVTFRGCDIWNDTGVTQFFFGGTTTSNTYGKITIDGCVFRGGPFYIWYAYSTTAAPATPAKFVFANNEIENVILDTPPYTSAASANIVSEQIITNNRTRSFVRTSGSFNFLTHQDWLKNVNVLFDNNTTNDYVRFSRFTGTSRVVISNNTILDSSAEYAIYAASNVWVSIDGNRAVSVYTTAGYIADITSSSTVMLGQNELYETTTNASGKYKGMAASAYASTAFGWGTASPVHVPTGIGHMWLDQTNRKFYISASTTGASDWLAVN